MTKDRLARYYETLSRMSLNTQQYDDQQKRIRQYEKTGHIALEGKKQ